TPAASLISLGRASPIFTGVNRCWPNWNSWHVEERPLLQRKRRVEFSPLRMNSNWSPLGRTALAIGEETAIPETFTVFSQGQAVPNTGNLQHSGAIHLVFR